MSNLFATAQGNNLAVQQLQGQPSIALSPAFNQVTSKFKTHIPPSLYMRPPQIGLNPVKREKTHIFPLGNRSYTLSTNGGERLLFRFPSAGMLVRGATELRFTLDGATDATHNFETPGAHSLIRSIRVMIGGNQVEYIQEYPLLAKDYLYKRDNLEQRWNEGVGSFDDNRSTDATGVFRRAFNRTVESINGKYAVPLILSGVFNPDLDDMNCLPLHLCGDVTLEIELSPREDAFVIGGANDLTNRGAADYVMSDIRLGVENLILPDSFYSSLHQDLASGKLLQIKVPTFQVHTETLATGTTAKTMALPGANLSRVNTLSQTIITAPAGTTSRYATRVLGLSEYQVRVGVTDFPQGGPITDKTNLYREFLRANDLIRYRKHEVKMSPYLANVAPNTAFDTHCVACTDLRTYDAGMNVMTGRQLTGDLAVKFTITASAAGDRVISWIQLDRILSLSGQGAVVVE